jgi:hypothetical protein
MEKQQKSAEKILKSYSIPEDAIWVEVIESTPQDEVRCLVRVIVTDDCGEPDRMLTVCHCHAAELGRILNVAASYAKGYDEAKA